MLHKESVAPNVLELIGKILEKAWLKDFDQNQLLDKLETDFEFELDYIEFSTVKGTIEGVKADFLSHKYAMVKQIVEKEGIRLAAIEDISAMKVNAISNDGTRAKDFIDIYFLLKEKSIEQLLDCYQLKYKLRNTLHALKSLNYFEEVRTEDWPEIIREPDLSWKKVTKTIDAACSDYLRSLKDS